MATNRAKQLEKLSASLPGANQQVAQGLQAARQTQMQQQIASMQPGQATPAAAQAIGGQQAAQAGAINLQAAQQAQTQQQLTGQMALQGQARQQRQEGFQQQMGLSAQQNRFAGMLNKLGSETKNALLDEQLTFKKNQAGQSLFNERQRLDWAVTQAKSAEEFNNYKQAETQVHRKKMIMLESAHKKITQTLQQGYLKGKQELDQSAKKKLIQAKAELEKKIQKEQNKAKNKMAKWSAGGQILGAGIGAVVGGPVGASVGGAIGGGLGSILGAR